MRTNNDRPTQPEGAQTFAHALVGVGAALGATLVVMLVSGLYGAVTTSDEERATDEAADRVVRVIDRHDGHSLERAS